MQKNKSCPNCKTLNLMSANFCEGCGTKLPSEAVKQCQKCNAVNPADARFCFKCGNELDSFISKKKQANPGKKTAGNSRNVKQRDFSPAKIAAVAFAVIIIYLIIPEDKAATLRQPVQQVQQIIEQKLADPAREAVVLDIASKFICSCGTCGEQPLNTCSCEVARTERQFIRNGLQNNKDADTIIKAVNQKYGWIKAQFESIYGPGKFRFDTKTQTLPTPGLDILNQKSAIGLASFDDRLAIISSFACTCGQCNIPELKDCNCSHPGGATEVKNFIDQKIRENEFTKENIIHLVEARYGDRIR